MHCSVDFVRLLLAALVWFLLHAAVAGTGLRFALIARFGEKAYRGGFALASIAALWWLVMEYRHAPFIPLWLTPRPLYYFPLVIVPVAFVFLVGAFTLPSPTAVGGERFLVEGDPARGLLRVTRHPFLWSVVLWSVSHLLVNADMGSLVFFSSLGLTALRGTFDIDRKRRRTNAEGFARFEAKTSNIPFAALAQGKNRLVLHELWLPLGFGLLLALGAAALHPHFFGAPVVPGLHG